MPIATLTNAHEQLLSQLTQHLGARASSVFSRLGEAVSRKHASALLTALRDDLGSGKYEAMRPALHRLIEELYDEGLTFSDLRFLVQTLRTTVHAPLTATVDAARLQSVEDWFFELVLVATARYMARREEVLQERTVKLELERLESQLGELQAALREKTKLLEIIRQASTPIAPVVRGILVVPLVGVFDAFRAEVLTEKLLEEVARVHARSVILDISGVPMFDTESAQLIIRLARTVRLLGTEIILVGMSPGNARTIVDLGIDLVGLRTLGTLQDGLAQALVLQRLQIVALD
jgi:rsbT co-antagonist protein RsbR